MPRLPENDGECVAWAAYHLAIWAGQGVAPTIGMTPEQVAAAQLELTSATNALSAVDQIRAQSLAKTLDKDLKIEALRDTLGGLITQIDGFAKATKDQGVYVRAEIPEPAPKTPRSEAATPTNLRTLSQTDGSVLVAFDAVKGAGTVFLLQRQYVLEGGAPGPWIDGPTLSERKFLDENIPGGLALINYRVRAQLTNGVLSPWSYPVPFYLGGSGAGAQAATVASAASVDGTPTTGDGGGPDGLTIEDAQALKDAQTAKGSEKAS